MDAVAKAMKAMVEQASDDCEHASEDALESWAASDTLMAVFAQKELVYRDQKRSIEAMEVAPCAPNCGYPVCASGCVDAKVSK